MSVKISAELEVLLYSFDSLGGLSSGRLRLSYIYQTDVDFFACNRQTSNHKALESQKTLAAV